MTVILGINAFHADSSACLVIDGVLKHAVAEERLGRRMKHSAEFPAHAINRVLSDSGVRLRDVTHVAVARNSKANLQAKLQYVIGHPVTSALAVLEHYRRNTKNARLHELIAKSCDSDLKDARFKVFNIEHHLAHIASAYYLSPFDTLTAGFSYDASGDFVSMMAARCEGTKIDVLEKVFLPDSLGFFYTGLCQFIGFKEFGEEYKVMGLASYGENEFSELMKELIYIHRNGWFSLNRSYFRMHEGGESGAMDDHDKLVMGLLYKDLLVKKLGAPRNPSELLTSREKNLAKSCQDRFEDVTLHCLTRLSTLVKTSNIAMAGGCSLNGVMNARILQDTNFSNQYIQCAASDDGTSIGAAYYCWHQILGQQKRFQMTHPYWGPEYSEDQIRKVAQQSGHNYQAFDSSNDLLEEVSDLLVDGKVVGWYQGRSEWGPRALGNRSILANPTLPHMKDSINRKIKRRESFRPFAPTVLRELVHEYFELDVGSPFMMHVVKIKPEWRAKLPAVTHVDGTGRLQPLSWIRQ